ncbi:MAG TPA: PQQ-binding-like beta-propeller repeat protein, partial [Ilumatobacteraceae bacterium]|nr:PQQ-binding-like beta-propeller repeat protein [Ilumatobacteraceae bacterium]
SGVAVADEARIAAERQLATERRSARRLRRSLVAASLLLVVAIVGGSLAIVARDRAAEERDAAERERVAADEQRDLADAARDEADDQRDAAQVARLIAAVEGSASRPDLAMLLAVEAARRSDSPEARGAMFSALTRPDASTDQQPKAELTQTPSFLGYIATGLPAPMRVVISEDGTTIAVSTNESHTAGNVFATFDLETRTLIHRSDLSEAVGIARLSPDGSWAIVFNEHVVDRISTADGTRQTLVEAPAGRIVRGVSLSHDATLVSVTWGDDVAFPVDEPPTAYDALTGAVVDVGEPPPAFVGLAGFVNDTTLSIAVQETDLTGGVAFWNVRTRTLERYVPLETPPSAYPPGSTFTFSPDVDRLVMTFGSPMPSMYVWDLETGHLVGDAVRRPTKIRGPVAFLTDDLIVLGHYDGSITFYDLAIEEVVDRRPLAHSGGVWGVDTTPDGQVMVSAADDGSVVVWGPSDHGLVDSTLYAGRRPAVSSDGTRVGAITPRRGAHFMSADGSDPLTLEPGSDAIPADVMGIRMSGDGSRAMLVVSDNATFQAVTVVDTRDGRLLWRTPAEVEPTFITGAELSADGTIVYVVWRDGAALTAYDIATGEAVSMGVEPTRSDNFSDAPSRSWDGKYLYLGTANEILRLDAHTLEILSRVGHDDVLQGNLVSIPGTDDVVGVGRQGRIVRVNMATGEILRSLSRDSSSLGGVAVSADGSMIAALHPFDGGVALFDAATLEPIGLPIPTLASDQSPPSFLADGSLVAQSPWGVRRWELDVDRWQDLACFAAGRNMTMTEWREYFGEEPYQATCSQWPAGT